ncbi:MAG TPA: type II secretion system F family protein [Phycisphaerae bacterium]|nr:type II secretion system F family protein [Phycisphaerae bacterium]
MSKESPAPREPAPEQFRYEAQDSAGAPVRGTLEAEGPADAEARLTRLGLRALAIEPAPVSGRKARALGADDFLLFNRQLAHLTKAGLPVERGLRLIAGDMKSGRLAAASEAVAAELEKGKSLPEAFAVHARRFPPLYARLMEAGIKTGNLPGVLFSLGRHLELAARLRQMLWNTLAYPVGVLAGLVVIMGLIATYILPMMRGVYSGFKVQLPWITRAFLWVGDQMPIVLGVAAGVAVLLIGVGIFVRFRGGRVAIVDRLTRALPGVGPVIARGQLARWCDALKMAVEAGLDLPAALELASEAVGSAGLRHDGALLAETVRGGNTLDAAPATRVIPPAVPAAVALAGPTGDLPATLSTLSRMYGEQAEERLRSLPALIMPILFLIIAVGFGLTLTAMFLPMIQLIQAVSAGDWDE